MSTSNPSGAGPPPEPTTPDIAATGETPAHKPDGPKKRRNPWIWISGLLALIAIGLLVWALNTNSDLDSTQNQVDDLQSQVDQGQKAGSSFVSAAKTAFQNLTEQLGATSENLDTAQKDVADAQQTADQAQKDADAAKQSAEKANNATAKAKAETDQAKSEAKAAESKATVAADCAKAYVSAIGSLFEGDGVSAQAAKVSDQLKGITSDCQAALAGT